MKYAVVKEYYSSFCAGQSDVIISVKNTFNEAADAAVSAYVAEYPDAANFTELHRAVVCNNKLKCETHILRIHSNEQAIGYQGQKGFFSIENAGSQNVFIRLLRWIPTQPATTFRNRLFSSVSGD